MSAKASDARVTELTRELEETGKTIAAEKQAAIDSALAVVREIAGDKFDAIGDAILAAGKKAGYRNMVDAIVADAKTREQARKDAEKAAQAPAQAPAVDVDAIVAAVLAALATGKAAKK